MYPDFDKHQDLRQPRKTEGPSAQDRPDIAHELSELTDRVTAVRVVTTMQREGRLSLTGKMAALTERAQDFHKKTETVLDGIAEKISKAESKRDVAAGKHHSYYDGIIAGVDESVAVIDRLSNGPLQEGGEG
jgi:hypothetical protein